MSYKFQSSHLLCLLKWKRLKPRKKERNEKKKKNKHAQFACYERIVSTHWQLERASPEPRTTNYGQMVDFGSMYMRKMLQISSYARGSSKPTMDNSFALKDKCSFFKKRKNPYDILTKISRWTIFVYHLRATLIGLWILLKWFFQFLWHSIQQSIKPHQSITSVGDQSYFHDKPPPCLVDNRIGLQSYVKLKGTKLHYIEAGNRCDPLILLLHGFPDCWLGWHNQVIGIDFSIVAANELRQFDRKTIWQKLAKRNHWTCTFCFSDQRTVSLFSRGCAWFKGF